MPISATKWYFLSSLTGEMDSLHRKQTFLNEAQKLETLSPLTATLPLCEKAALCFNLPFLHKEF
jgi:hypothetical protein